MELAVEQMNREIDDAFDLHENIAKIGNDIKASGTLSMEHALALDNASSSLEAVTRYFAGGEVRRQLATEGIIESLFTAIGRVFESIIRLIMKFISWLIGSPNTDKSAVSAKEAVKEINSQVDMKSLDAGVSAAMESILALERDSDINVPIRHIYQKWSESLKDQEVDFITSGKRYNSIQNVLRHFSQSDMPGFISSLSTDVERWMTEGFSKAPHVGRDEAVVAGFIRDMRKSFDGIKTSHSADFHHIDQMENEAKINQVVGNHDHLQLFLKSPSRLFPHLEMIWNSIDFRKIDEDDCRLIKELEKVRRQFEQSVGMLKSKLGLGESSWPAMEAFTRLAHEANREIAKRITALAHVCHFIKKSAEIAFHATVKCFSYIRQLMKELSKVPQVDHDLLIRGFDTIQRKYSELTAMVEIAQ